MLAELWLVPHPKQSELGRNHSLFSPWSAFSMPGVMTLVNCHTDTRIIVTILKFWKLNIIIIWSYVRPASILLSYLKLSYLTWEEIISERSVCIDNLFVYLPRRSSHCDDWLNFMIWCIMPTMPIHFAYIRKMGYLCELNILLFCVSVGI